MAEGTQNQKSEGARSITRFIDGLRHGRFAPKASEEFQALLRELSDTAIDESAVVKGKFTIELGLTVNAMGEVQVVGDYKRTSRKPKAASNNYYITKGMNLTTEDPRQTSLPLREVRAPRLRGEEGDEVDDEQGGAQ